MNKKKIVRAKFRLSVFTRDNFACKICGLGVPQLSPGELDAHHITDINDMPNGGYVAENGITLCPDCHLKAELVQPSDELTFTEFGPEHLYKLIGSSVELAIKASRKLS